MPKHLSDLSDLTASATKTTAVNPSQPKPPIRPQTLAPMEQKEDKLAVKVAEKDTLNLDKAFKNPDHNPESNVSLISAIGLSYKSNWSEFTEGSKIIHQFIPLPDVSSFFNKLKTFGESQ